MPTPVLCILALVHLLLCAALLALSATGRLRARLASLALALFVPVFGPVGTALLEARLRDEDARCEEFDIEELCVNDAVHRSILMEQSTVGDEVVPLRDALLINDASMRRDLIMDVLYEGASDQPHALRAARGNDDAEVVHYATTALVELQRSFDDDLAHARRACKERPDDAAAALRLADVLRDYVASGLLEGSMLAQAREEYARALEALCALVPTASVEALDACVRAFACAVERADASSMRRWAERTATTWPRREEGHLMRLRCCVGSGDRAGVDAALAALDSGDVRLSARGRREAAYWRLSSDAAPAPVAPTAPAATPASPMPAPSSALGGAPDAR